MAVNCSRSSSDNMIDFLGRPVITGFLLFMITHDNKATYLFKLFMVQDTSRVLKKSV